MASEYRLRITTTGIEFDAVVEAAVGRPRDGSGGCLAGCGRDMEWYYDNAWTRDAAYKRAKNQLNGIPGVLEITQVRVEAADGRE